MRDSVFKLSYFLSANEKFHIARVNITSSQDLSLHSHDYAESYGLKREQAFTMSMDISLDYLREI